MSGGLIPMKMPLERRLDNMSYKVVIIRQSEQIDRGRTSSTCESDDQFATRQKLFRDFGAAFHPVRSFATAGVSLLKIGSAKPGSSPGAGAENRFHRQAFLQSCPPGAPAGALGKAVDQRLGRSGVASLVAAIPEQWLNERVSRNCAVSSSTSLIVTRLKRWRRFIAGWLQMSRRTRRGRNNGA